MLCGIGKGITDGNGFAFFSLLSGLVFPLSFGFKLLFVRVGIVGASSHSGRRTFITKLATSGVSVRVIAEAVGHSSIATTQRYIDVNDELIGNAAELV